MRLLAPTPLLPTHVVDAFSCGVAVLDQCLKRRALINQQGGASRAFVTADDARRVRREWIW